MATLQDVASLAGVSTATVSRTLNNPDLVGLTTRSLVATAIEECGYSPNQTARSLASRSSRTIGLLTDKFVSNYFAPILDAAVSVIHQYNYFTIVESTGIRSNENDIEKKKNACRALIDRQVESIIMVGVSIMDNEIEELLQEFPTLVVIGRDIAHSKQRCVTFDDYLGGRLAAKHLVEKGHRDIAMITGRARMLDTQHRSKGFTDELITHGIQLPDTSIFSGNYQMTSGADAMRAIINSKNNFSAVFAQNDDMAAGVIGECYRAGIQIPTDLSIIGFDNSVLATVTSPALTSINQPLGSMSQSAAALALNLCVSRRTSKSIAHPQTHFLPELIDRQSVADISHKDGRTR